jgi:hypothetical protein
MLKSPVIIISLFSLSIFCRKVSKQSSIPVLLDPGGRYHVEIIIGLDFGFFISRQIASTFSGLEI